MNVYTEADVREALKQPSNVQSAKIIIELQREILRLQDELVRAQTDIGHIKMLIATGQVEGL